MQAPGSDDAASGKPNCLVEFATRGGLVRAYTSGSDGGFVIVFALDWAAGQAAEHGELTDVRERVGYWTLEEAFDGSLDRLGRSEEIVELL